jgi:hypothetical protein
VATFSIAGSSRVKNFPHQINKLDRLARGLAVFAKLSEEGLNLHDDGIVGDALARAAVYTFRGRAARSARIDHLLVHEHKKPLGSRGTRTAARELRRTFELLGLLEHDAGNLRLTAAGIQLSELESSPLSPEARALWGRAFHDLALADESGVSHPYEVMLRLAGECPGIQKPLLGLAFEAKDDSESEFRRLLRLVDDDATSPAWEKLGVSKSQQANSIKILPAVAEQLGELALVNGGAYFALPDPFAPREQSRRRTSSAVRARRRRYDGSRRRGQRPKVTGVTMRAYDPDLVAARYEAHEECLSAFDALVPTALDRWEGDYDLLISASGELLLVEVKTIRADASTQLRLGLGQLLYYEYFDVRPDWPKASIRRMLVTDGAIDPELADYLDAHDVGLVTQSKDKTWLVSQRAKDQLTHFGIRL